MLVITNKYKYNGLKIFYLYNFRVEHISSRPRFFLFRVQCWSQFIVTVHERGCCDMYIVFSIVSVIIIIIIIIIVIIIIIKMCICYCQIIPMQPVDKTKVTCCIDAIVILEYISGPLPQCRI